jgi:hypothetical protein
MAPKAAALQPAQSGQPAQSAQGKQGLHRIFTTPILFWQRNQSYDPIIQILDTNNPQSDEQTRAWSEAKKAELTSVAVTVRTKQCSYTTSTNMKPA